jgi:hypothetical protein
MKPILMIHEIRDWMFDLPLHNYVLTFDDGLYSQYYFLDKFKTIDTEKIFFISTGILCDENEIQSTTFPKCSEAHSEFFSTGNRKNYMKWSQAKEIYNTPKCFIGGHSHNHNRYQNNDIKNLFAELNADTEKMFEEFRKQDIVIFKFCYPYNEQYVLYESILKKYSISEFYGKERIAIESLQ